MPLETAMLSVQVLLIRCVVHMHEDALLHVVKMV
jgi:hypothetical protein